ncbi:MAG: TolC family protein, partial [Candidatus Binatia bacterium]
MRRARTALIGALALAAGTAHAADGGLTVSDAVARALRDGPEAKIARLEAGEATDTASAARSIYWPHASISSQAGWSNRQDDTLNAIDGEDVLKRYPLSSLGSNEAWLSVYLDQMIFDLRGWRFVERSELEAEVGAVAEAQQREAISFAVLERYVAVLRLEQLAAVDAQRLRDAEWLDRQAGVLLESGRALAAEREQVALGLDEVRLATA